MDFALDRFQGNGASRRDSLLKRPSARCPRTYSCVKLLDSKCPWPYPVRMPRSRQPDPDAVRFGAILRRERIARGWTIVKLARRSGMHHQYLGVVEAGGNIPSLSTLLGGWEGLRAHAGGRDRAGGRGG